MPRNVARTILQRQLEIRRRLWPEFSDEMLWSMKEGWVAIPRLMPLMLSIMDDLSGKGFPVGRTYLELWTRMRIEEGFVALNRPEEMAFHAGFEGQRALRTWKDRMSRLNTIGLISLKSGPLGDYSYAILRNPYHIIKQAHAKGRVHDNKWQALMVRANEINAYDIDDVSDDGSVILDEIEETEKEEPISRAELKKNKRVRTKKRRRLIAR
jgi:hypothetical protein